MSWDTVPGRNGEGYPDPTASTALARVQHSQKGLQSKRAGEHFENMITASLNWYCDKGVAFIEKTPEPMKPLRKPDRQGRFLACWYNVIDETKIVSSKTVIWLCRFPKHSNIEVLTGAESGKTACLVSIQELLTA